MFVWFKLETNGDLLEVSLCFFFMSQVRGCKYISLWKKSLSAALGHAGHHLVLMFRADFTILSQVFCRIGSNFNMIYSGTCRFPIVVIRVPDSD